MFNKYLRESAEMENDKMIVALTKAYREAWPCKIKQRFSEGGSVLICFFAAVTGYEEIYSQRAGELELKGAVPRNRAWLLATAKAVAVELKRRREGVQLKIRTPHVAVASNTDGWVCVIGNLKLKRLLLEIYLDRFSG